MVGMSRVSVGLLAISLVLMVVAGCRIVVVDCRLLYRYSMVTFAGRRLSGIYSWLLSVVNVYCLYRLSTRFLVLLFLGDHLCLNLMFASRNKHFP
jgi:hypothetical protein